MWQFSFRSFVIYCVPPWKDCGDSRSLCIRSFFVVRDPHQVPPRPPLFVRSVFEITLSAPPHRCRRLVAVVSLNFPKISSCEYLLCNSIYGTVIGNSKAIVHVHITLANLFSPRSYRCFTCSQSDRWRMSYDAKTQKIAWKYCWYWYVLTRWYRYL